MATQSICIVCSPQPNPSFTLLLLCLSYMHSHFNYTFMYILPQLGRPTNGPAHWLTGRCALCPATHQPLFYATATLCLSYMHSHFNHIYMYILPQSARLTGACMWPRYCYYSLSFYCCFISLLTVPCESIRPP